MNELTIPFHLLIPTIICFIGIVLLSLNYKKTYKKNRLFFVSLTVFLILYFLIVASATYDDIFYQLDLNRYDIDNDGIFSDQEITPEQIAAMERYSNDIGRNFSFVIGFLFALIISSITYIIGLLFLKAKKNEKN